MTLVFLPDCASVDDGEMWLNVDHIVAIHRAMVPTSETTEEEGVMIMVADQRYFLFRLTIDEVLACIDGVDVANA